MAASDQTYRSQKGLDFVFGATCVLMLVSVVLLFAQDYFQPWKPEQRKFRDVDQAVTQRMLLSFDLDKKLDDAVSREKAVAEARQKRDAARKEGVGGAQYTRDRAYARTAEIKAQYDSKVSLYNIAVDNRDNASSEGQRSYYKNESEQLQAEVQRLAKELQQANDALDQAEAELRDKKKKLTDAEIELVAKEDELKQVTGEVDRVAKAVAQKHWGFGDFLRRLPLLDGFASPLKINQITLEGYPIDYSFKRVTRYDRCTTCHLGIDQEKFSEAGLRDLPKGEDKAALLKKLHELYERRKKNGEQLGWDPSDLPTNVLTVELSEGRIKQFAAHPRLDLFLDAKSPHPMEKFGCTSCHAGQGSATNFDNASHVPNNAPQRQRWIKEHDWEMTPAGDWEYPMLPHRFVESSCLKCHHQVTDLIRNGSREEAPQVLRGYNLIKDFGCYGCHEIAGFKQGQDVGPDLRLELSPPLESLSPGERDRLLADRMNPPGTLRKVGPSLFRISEKTNLPWLGRWINDPRGFRPDTKMPHFYGLSNNNQEVLPDDQKPFPDIEVQAIARYLQSESNEYLKGNDIYYRLYEIRLKELEARKEENKLTEKEGLELTEIMNRLDAKTRKEYAPALQLREKPKPLTQQIIDGKGNVLDPKTLPAPFQGTKLADGGRLFRERGCLACHSHDATARSEKGEDLTIKPLVSEANFGPNLSRLKAKLGTDNEDPQATRLWLVQWILNPNIHNPRTRMPITHLTLNEAAQVADWLLTRDPGSLEDWAKVDTDIKLDDLSRLVRVYVTKAPGFTRKKVDSVLEPKGDSAVVGYPKNEEANLSWSADERALVADGDKGVSKEKLLWYVGRKAVNRLGCFGCHDIPGFETAKPIGTQLNDWGKKDADRLAFEDILAYVDHGHKGKGYQPVQQIWDDNGKVLPELKDTQGKVIASRDEEGRLVAKSEDGKDLIEKFYLEALSHHQRDGFLYQKLNEPRSYDYHRNNAWDDRLRMPQFKFARKAATLKENDPERQVEEAEAREAVMTFVLGLVAEPVPSRYRNDPDADRLAEVKGRQVLDKFNCAGCHLLRAGVYDFKLNDQTMTMLGKQYQKTAKPEIAKGYPELFRDHNAWVGQPQARPDRVRAFAIEFKDSEVTDEESGEQVPTKAFRPTQAVRVKIDRSSVLSKLDIEDKKDWTFDLPAGLTLDMLPDAYIGGSDPVGGTFGNLVIAAKYLEGHPGLPANAQQDEFRSILPPPLHREGEKVQPAWLERFLHDPKPIRPPERMLLRMPKFNMSDEEVAILVNYFLAVDKLENPGVNNPNPRIAQEQLNEDFWNTKNKQYADRLGGKVKERAKDKDFVASLREFLQYQQLPDTERRLKDKSAEVKAQEEATKDAKTDADKKDAEARLKQLQAEEKSLTELLKQLQDQAKSESLPDLESQWSKDGYGTDAYRLLVQRSKEGMCLECHQIANHQPNNKRGPTLFFRKDQKLARMDETGGGQTDHEAYITSERLRPEWTARWIAQPSRLHGYSPIMLQVFESNNPLKIQLHLFEGEQAERIKALRDILMDMPQIYALPGNRFYRWEMGGKK